MLTRRCPRCKGQQYKEWKDIVCLCCGRREPIGLVYEADGQERDSWPYPATMILEDDSFMSKELMQWSS